MEWVETTGRTVEEAKDAALDQLGVAEDDAEFEILEEPRSGLFGRLRNEARVRARVRPATPRPKDERGGRRRGRPARKGNGNEAPRGGGGERSRERAPRPRQERAAPDRERAPAPVRGQSGGNEMSDEPSLDEQGQVAEEFVAGLVEAMGLPETRVDRHQVDDETVEVRIDGEPGRLGVLIGPRAQTLVAIQELARTVVQRQTGARQGRIVVDVAGYRERRRTALEGFTRGVAAEVRQSGVPAVLEPMSPSDRKVVHDTVNEIDGVSTTSEGEHGDRRVVIVADGAQAAG